MFLYISKIIIKDLLLFQDKMLLMFLVLIMPPIIIPILFMRLIHSRLLSSLRLYLLFYGFYIVGLQNNKIISLHLLILELIQMIIIILSLFKIYLILLNYKILQSLGDFYVLKLKLMRLFKILKSLLIIFQGWYIILTIMFRFCIPRIFLSLFKQKQILLLVKLSDFTS